PDPEARHQFLGLRKRTVDHRRIAVIREREAFPGVAGLQAIGSLDDAGLGEFLVELAHVREHLFRRFIGREQPCFAIRGRFDEDYDFHAAPPFYEFSKSSRSGLGIFDISGLTPTLTVLHRIDSDHAHWRTTPAGVLLEP